ncbi:hypothetical protein G7Z17_g11556 [Cylindrodendrum hubeiense]|uniref:Apple domain-containing protein n=1 Tax=Cylindrodendrum hubeiense TaxID=595255 RepID=A0A9P5LBI5_9HYPO|nr:hypothetical protein G7Z17_g11556 [Cylindrodendrum hubeiense]
MSLFKVIATVAALGLAGVEAGGAPFCSELFPRPDAYTCNVEGFISKPAGILGEPVFKATAEGCADHCADTDKCTSFLFHEGTCQPYQGSFSTFGFTEHKTYSVWYEMECFRCSDAGVVIGVDFEEGSYGSWSVYGSTKDAFTIDTKAKGFDGSATALRIVEGTKDGTGRIQWEKEISLKTGVTYALGFAMKNNKRDQLPLSAELLTLTVANNHQNILHTSPEHAIELSDGWTEYHSTFKVPADLAGGAVFSIGLKSTGKLVEWYFDDIYIKNISE